jgi:hypothetical protein
MMPIKTKTPCQAWTVYRRDPRNDADGIKIFGEKNFHTLRKKALEGGVDGPLGQTKFVVRQGMLCAGVIDKTQIGSSIFGLVHAVHGKCLLLSRVACLYVLVGGLVSRYILFVEPWVLYTYTYNPTLGQLRKETTL